MAGNWRGAGTARDEQRVKSFPGRDRLLNGFESNRPRRTVRVLGSSILVVVALLTVFLTWPYVTVWRLDQAVRNDDTAALSELVDLEAVRGEIKKKLNKDADSTIGDPSNSFIRWLQDGIQTLGGAALDQLVTLSWVRERLQGGRVGDDSEGFLGVVTYAFFDAPDGFVVRIGSAMDAPVHVRLALRGWHWRVTAVYY